MKKPRFNKDQVKTIALGLFLDLLWLLGMSLVTIGVYEIIGFGTALVVAGCFCLGIAYLKTQQFTSETK